MAINLYTTCSPLTIGCTLYTNSNLTISASNGVYYDGSTCWTVSSGVITGTGSCTTTTTTTTTSTTTTTTTAEPTTTTSTTTTTTTAEPTTTTTTTSTTTTTTTEETYTYYAVTQYLNCVQNSSPGAYTLRVPSSVGGSSWWCGDDGFQYQFDSNTSGPAYDITATSTAGSCPGLPC